MNMSIGSSGIQSMSGGMSRTQENGRPPKMDDKEILKKITQDFGEDAATKVTDDKGGVDKTKLKELLESKGVKAPPMRPPMGGGGMRPAAPAAEEEDDEDTETLIEKLTKAFSEEEAKGILNEDGTINTDKLGSLFESKGMQRPPSQGGGQGTQTGESTLLQKFSETFGKDEESKITDDEGKLDSAKLWSYLSEKMQDNKWLSTGTAGWPPGQLLNTKS